MFGFSKKRFFIILAISVAIWLVTGIIQGYVTFADYVGTLSMGCPTTGYPIDVCTPSFRKIPVIIVNLFNILFWFWVIHLFWGFIEKRKS